MEITSGQNVSGPQWLEFWLFCHLPTEPWSDRFLSIWNFVGPFQLSESVLCSFSSRASVDVESLTISRTLVCARVPYELIGGAHEPQPACPMGVLVRGVIDGVDGAAAKLQPISVKQELHHVQEVQGEEVSAGAHEAHHRTKRPA